MSISYHTLGDFVIGDPSSIDRFPDREATAERPGERPAVELAHLLSDATRRGVRVDAESTVVLGDGIQVDLVVSGPQGAFGIICDALDTQRLRSRQGALGGAGLDTVYGVSAVDVLMNSPGVVQQIAQLEPAFVRRRPSSGPISHVLVEVAGESATAPGTCRDEGPVRKRARGAQAA